MAGGSCSPGRGVLAFEVFGELDEIGQLRPASAAPGQSAVEDTVAERGKQIGSQRHRRLQRCQNLFDDFDFCRLQEVTNWQDVECVDLGEQLPCLGEQGVSCFSSFSENDLAETSGASM